MSKCNNCGAELNGSMKFCTVCGIKAEHETANELPAGNADVSTNGKGNMRTTATICKNCGTEVPRKMSFCAACGTQALHEATSEPTDAVEAVQKRGEKPGIDIKKFFIPAVAVAIVIVAIIIAINVFSSGKYDQIKGFVYVTQNEDSVVVIANGKAGVELEGFLVKYQKSLDGKVAAILIAETNNYYDNSSGRLLYLVTDKPQLITDDADAFWLSANGGALTYTKGSDIYEGIAELWYYRGGESTRLTSDYSIQNQCAISPDGKAVAFVTSRNDSHTGFIWDGKNNEIGRDVIPVAVSNGAKYIYFIRNNSFYVQKGTNSDKREKLADSPDLSMICANKDFSEIVYNSGSRAYISSKGGSKVSLSGAVSSFIMPDNTAKIDYSIGRLGSVVYGVSSFANTFYRNNENSVIRINGKRETSSVVRSVSSVYLANDGKTLTYLRNGSIYQTNGAKADSEADRIVERDVSNLIATDDGNAVFFGNNSGEMYFQKGTGKPVLVTDFTQPGRNGARYSLFKGKTVFYISEGELYSSSGGKGKRIRGIEGSVVYTEAIPGAVIAQSYDDGDGFTYLSTNGNKFELMLESRGVPGNGYGYWSTTRAGWIEPGGGWAPPIEVPVPPEPEPLPTVLPTAP